MRIELSAVMSELLTILMELLTTLMELLAVLTILLTMFMNLSTLLPIFSTVLLNLIHTEVGNYQQKCCDIFHIFRGGTPSALALQVALYNLINFLFEVTNI